MVANRKRRPESEAAFASWFEDLLALRNWLWYHVHDSRRDRAGFPDYVCVRGERLLFVELKGVDARGDKGRLRPDQKRWLAALDETPAEAYVWWPDARGEIMAVLR